MNDNQFAKLFEFVQKIDEKVDHLQENVSTKSDIQHVLTVIDGYVAKLDTYATEMAAMQHKIDRV